MCCVSYIRGCSVAASMRLPPLPIKHLLLCDGMRGSFRMCMKLGLESSEGLVCQASACLPCSANRQGGLDTLAHV